MAKSKLNLNFALETEQERKAFIDQYIETNASAINFNSGDLEMMANFILWGKSDNNENEYPIEIETRHNTWKKKPSESLDSLMEDSTFTERQIQSSDSPRIKVKKVAFDRDAARANAPAFLLPIFEDLWHTIDELDYITETYEILNGKRKTPIRDELLNLITIDRQDELTELAASLTQRQYLNRRHLLVELRREQFTYKDTYAYPILRHTITSNEFPTTIAVNDTIRVLPCGTPDTPLGGYIFRPLDKLLPWEFSEQELKDISHLLWSQNNEDAPIIIDFSNNEHLYQLAANLSQLEEDSSPLYNTFKYYASIADLNDCQREILDLRLSGKTNVQIVRAVNAKYGTHYTANYCSTIFTQKIIPAISLAAQQHRERIENLSFPENFKKCGHCGTWYLLNPINFTRKARSHDGFVAICKHCEAKRRKERKLEKENTNA